MDQTINLPMNNWLTFASITRILRKSGKMSILNMVMNPHCIVICYSLVCAILLLLIKRRKLTMHPLQMN